MSNHFHRANYFKSRTEPNDESPLGNRKNGNWSSLDIYLFSNGQQYSPPRKYNLRAEELTWWDSTLNYLARVHYGSMHTNIELYTIDGKKVKGPLELSNGAAYVAVEPPDTFIQSGYSKYLIKASRSWEKRQERRISTIAIIDKTNTSNVLTKSEEPTDYTNIKIIQDITIIPNSSPVKEEDNLTTIKSDSVSKTKPSTPRSSARQTQKKPPLVTPQRPVILRKKYVNPVAPQTKKGFRSSKEDSTKKGIGSNLIKNLENVVQPIEAEKPNTQTNEYNPDAGANNTPLAAIISKNAGKDAIKDENEHTIPLLNITSVSKITQNIILENEIVEKDILPVSYQNEAHHQSIFISPQHIPRVSDDGVAYKEEVNLPVFTNATENKVILEKNITANVIRQQMCPVSTPLPTLLTFRVESKVNMTEDKLNNSQHSQKNPVVTDTKTAENFVFFVSQGDTVNFKLHIEVTNSTSPMANLQNNARVEQPLVSNNMNTAVDSPGIEDNYVLVDNIQSNRNHGEAATLTIPWESILMNNNNLHERLDNLSVLGHCNCGSTAGKSIPLKAAPIYVDSNNYFILVPIEQLQENLSCNCKIEFPDPVTSNGTMEPKVSEKEISIYKNTSNSVGLAADKDGNESEPPEYINKDNKYTQTDWNNLLLEARHHENGHYSFHFPPLEMLKLYKFYNIL